MNFGDRGLRAFEFALAVAAILACATPARAMGYDSLSCQELWDRRTEILHRNGYCFTGALEIKTYGNEKCTVKDEAALVLSDIDRRDVDMIKVTEARKACPVE